MPVVRRIGPWKLYFYSNEGDEPPHVHVEAPDGVAKFWLDPLSLARSTRLRAHELRRMERAVERHRREFLEAWHEFFRSRH
jgi:hypothetical protein